MSAAQYPFGVGPFSAGPWPLAYRDLGGAAVIALGVSGDALRTFASTTMCQPGTWTLTMTPSGPLNDPMLEAA